MATYNAKVEEDRLFTAQRRMLKRDYPLSDIPTPLDQTYSHFKSEELSPWLCEVPSQVMRNGAYRWMTAKRRQLAGLAKAPRKRNPSTFETLLLTSELFRFVALGGVDAAGNPKRCIEIGTASNPIGRMDFVAKRRYSIPKMLTIGIPASGKWYVSFCFDETVEEDLRSESELAYELNGLSDEDLLLSTKGVDRNVSDNRFAASDGNSYDFRDIELRRTERRDRYRRRLQRKLARQRKGSANARKTKRKIARSFEKDCDLRKDFAHRTSKALVETGSPRLIAFEDLKVANMVRRPKARKNKDSGRWERNGARAKAGLTASILRSAWRSTLEKAKYKAARRNALVVSVPAAYSSQTCAKCGHVAKENRKNRLFKCVSCGHADHADANAAEVVRRRGVAMIRSRVPEGEREKAKRTGFRRKPEEKRSGSDTSRQPAETAQDRRCPTGIEAAVRETGNFLESTGNPVLV